MMQGHYGIFPSWRCQLACDYCSIRNSQIDRTVDSVHWTEWAKAVPRYVSPGSIVDVAGGEPLLYPGVVDLLHALGKRGIGWAVTTNGKALEVIERIEQEHPNGCVCFNVSDHIGNPEAPEAVFRLRRAGYRVNQHRVDHPAAGRRLAAAQVITYQAWRESRAVDGVKRTCTAGLRHWVADPRGDLWRCVVALETGQPSVGNIFTGRTEPTSMICDFGCTTCYTEDPASWCVEMREEKGATVA